VWVGKARILRERMGRLGMLLMQESREPLSETVVTRGCLLEQKLLRFPGKISPPSHDGETERIFEVVLVVDIHFLALVGEV
jgi:hypothetical protein